MEARAGNENPWQAAETVTVAGYLEAWLDHIQHRVRTITHEGYADIVHLHVVPALGTHALKDLRPLHIQTLYSDLLTGGSAARTRVLSTRTVVHVHRLLSGSLAQAVRWQLIPSNPAAGAQPPRVRRAKVRIVDRDLAMRILAAARETEFELPVAVALGTGMRRGEILALTWSDVDLEAGVLRVCRTLHSTKKGISVEDPKTERSRRAIPLPRFVTELLSNRAEQVRDSVDEQENLGNLIIRRRDGSAWDPDQFSAAWPRFLEKRSLPHVRFHDLRHAHATLMLLKGVHPKIVSERLGHASIGITLDVYSHVLPTMQSEAAKVVQDVLAPA